MKEVPYLWGVLNTAVGETKSVFPAEPAAASISPDDTEKRDEQAVPAMGHSILSKRPGQDSRDRILTEVWAYCLPT